MGIALFAITFFVSNLLVLNFGTNLITKESPAIKVKATDTQEKIAPPAIADATETDFVPEIRDLPNFEDIQNPDFKTKLVDVIEHGGVYRKSEVIAKSGETWLGLFEQNGKLSLNRTKVNVRLDPSQEGPGDEDYVRLSFNQRSLPLFIVKNSKALMPGPVTPLYHRLSMKETDEGNLPIKSLTIGYKEKFRLNGEEYTLRVAPGITRDGTTANVLILETDKRSQVITYNTYYRDTNTKYDIIGDLLWIGDLDGDGKLDLYFSDFGYEKGGFGSNLFLSSAAEDGKLVKQVASFGTAGC